MKRNYFLRDCLLAVVSILILICIVGFGVFLAKIISIKNILGIVFNFLGIVFNLWLIITSLGTLMGVGGMVFNADRLFKNDDDFEIKMSWFYPLLTGWLFLNIIIPYVYMYDVEPSIPLQKFHFVNSNIIQILDSNFGKIIHFSVYFLSAIPLMMVFAFLFAYLRDLKKKSKTPAVEKSQIPNDYWLLTSIVIIAFQFFYFVAYFTYPTLVFLMNE